MNASLAFLHLRSPRLKLAVIAMALLMSLASGWLLGANVSAEREPTDPVQEYCLQKATKGADEACQDANKIRDIRYAASWHCRDKSTESDEAANCVVRESKRLIDKITADPNPKSVEGFDLRMGRIIKEDLEKTGGAAGQPAPELNTGRVPFEPCVVDEGGKKTFTDENCTDVSNIPDPAARAAICSKKPSLQGCGTNANAVCDTDRCDLITKYINPLIQVLSVIFGLIIVASLIAGGIQYSASGGDPQKVTAAKKRIMMTIVALVAYAFLYGFIQFLVPGGVFNG